MIYIHHDQQKYRKKRNSKKSLKNTGIVICQLIEKLSIMYVLNQNQKKVEEHAKKSTYAQIAIKSI